MRDTTLAAVFIDFENIYYHLKQKHGGDPTDTVLDLIKALRKHLAVTFDETAISIDAYADFERITGEPQGELYLLGVETHNVLGTQHKNAADMKLCIEAMAVLYTRQNIQSFVFVAGDRDYIPVIQHLKKQGKTVRVVGFAGSVSGDLLTTLGEEYFVDAGKLVVNAPAPLAAAPVAVQQVRPGLQVARPAPSAPAQGGGTRTDLSSDGVRALEIMLQHYRHKPEIWMRPFLFKLEGEIPGLDQSQRKALVDELAQAGAIRIEQRDGHSPTGEEIKYSVILLEWNHPAVQRANG